MFWTPKIMNREIKVCSNLFSIVIIIIPLSYVCAKWLRRRRNVYDFNSVYFKLTNFEFSQKTVILKGNWSWVLQNFNSVNKKCFEIHCSQSTYFKTDFKNLCKQWTLFLKANLQLNCNMNFNNEMNFWIPEQKSDYSGLERDIDFIFFLCTFTVRHFKWQFY